VRDVCVWACVGVSGACLFVCLSTPATHRVRMHMLAQASTHTHTHAHTSHHRARRHSLHAIASQLSPAPGCGGIELLQAETFDLHCLQVAVARVCARACGAGCDAPDWHAHGRGVCVCVCVCARARCGAGWGGGSIIARAKLVVSITTHARHCTQPSPRTHTHTQSPTGTKLLLMVEPQCPQVPALLSR
jgi:hypothetical protein